MGYRDVAVTGYPDIHDSKNGRKPEAITARTHDFL
jgi:hypothetical protein